MRSQFKCGKKNPRNISGQYHSVTLAELGRIISFCGKRPHDPEVSSNRGWGYREVSHVLPLTKALGISGVLE